MIHLKQYEHYFNDERFKVGDIITCLRGQGCSYLINNGQSYIVTYVDGDLIKVDNRDEVLNRTRFRLATPEEAEEFKLKADMNKYNL